MKSRAGVLGNRNFLVALAVASIIIAAISIFFLVLRSHRDTRQTYAQAAEDFILQLQSDGLVVSRQIAPQEGGEPFLFLLVPATGEISEENIRDITELMVFSASVFEARGGLRSDDLFITFQRPASHSVILVDRPGGLPDPLGSIAEFSITDNEGAGWSVLNLGGTVKDLGYDFTIDWATIQAVCLAYAAHQFENADPVCNIIAANAAAGWAGVSRDIAESTLGGGGTTGLEYLGSRDYEFRFIEFVYNEFDR